MDVARGNMEPFGAYVGDLEDLLADIGGSLATGARVQAALNGEPFAKLREVIPVGDLRAVGAFFTGSLLAARAVAPIAASLDHESRIFDPTCGAGDLLLACATHLPRGASLEAIAKAWAASIWGLDTQQQFARAARVRLATAAATLNPVHDISPTSVPAYLRRVRTGDSLQATKLWRDATHIVLNPPFTTVPAPSDCSWGAGGVNQAALFVERAIRTGSHGATLIAILPDVLRSGARYVRWRQMVQDHTEVNSIEPWGRFDKNTDVDVFILRATICPPTRTLHPWNFTVENQRTVADIADVRVGSVVEFRHPKVGPSFPYATPTTVLPWTESTTLSVSRRFSGTVFQPPFVVIRRTSSPTDRVRAIAAIVDCRVPVAVENHLIVLKPHDASVHTCRRLTKLLKSEHATSWLNDRIRCRHLTVGSIKELPLPTWDA